MAIGLNTDIKFLKGVGEKRAELYKKIGILTIGDLLHYYPRDYIDATNPSEIASCDFGENVVLKLVVSKKTGEQRIRKGMSIFKILAYDDTSSIIITFFNTKYTAESLKIGEEYLFYGKVSGTLLKREMSSPLVLAGGDYNGLIPIYPLTAGISSKLINTNVKQALDLVFTEPKDALPTQIREDNKLCHIEYAVREIHNPTDKATMEIARKRLIFEELFILSLALWAIRGQSNIRKAPKMEKQDMQKLYSSLPYVLTNGQMEAISDIIGDLSSGKVMNRLVQGDVGCGKTMVAIAAIYFTFLNGGQSAMMAPTEILATQHYNSLEKVLKPLGVNVGLLTGSMTAKEKRITREKLLSGEINICIGTHALITKDVAFKNLSLVITDEQHRFGVNQRTALSQKGEAVHMLVMSATPIPRTLALIIYGDLEISQIRELPKGRTAIETMRIDATRRNRAFGFIKKHLDMGLQAYIICPLVEIGEVDMGLKSAVEYANDIAKGEFKDYKVGVIHGKMNQKEKDKIMAEFKDGEVQVLVATTVIEVGVDVPNAVIMLIENAERFGLSQLHQLRGRVGRGDKQSYCILVSDVKNEDTAKRLSAICKTSSGFDIAEEDLKLRGAGDFFGNRQHGLPQFQIADLSKDIELLKSAQEEAKKILKVDSNLSEYEHRFMKIKVEKMLEAVGYIPN
ncbi:MAG: ATP-dependent DNA helicase RecG [Oscillospiraceae bacterium]